VRECQIPVACVQLRAVDRSDFERRWEDVLALISSAGERGARLIVLPEGTVPGYVLGHEPLSLKQLERATDRVAAIARRYNATIVYGGAKVVGNRTFNAAIALGPEGRELGFAAKQFLWHFDRLWYAPGETLEPIDTPVGRLGLLVCADGRIPTIAATLAERGADMLVMPTAWVTSGRDPGALENIQADLMVNVRARENGIPFVACNKAGIELGAVAYCGKSTIVDAAGRTLARAGERNEELLLDNVRIGGDQRVGFVERFAGPALHGGPSDAGNRPAERLHIAFTLEREPDKLARLMDFAAEADADLFLAAGNAQPPQRRAGSRPAVLALPSSPSEHAEIMEAAGLRIVLAGDAMVHDPRGLVAARASGVDFVVWETRDEPEWQIRFARTRAAELRAYVVVFGPAAARAFAVDPDGAVVAGTFDDYRLASFTYDRSRTQATQVAPSTDVAEGLRTAERIRTTTMQTTSTRPRSIDAEGLNVTLADSSER